MSTFPNVTITPLKKTPPHFMSDDAANLSPAKHRPHVSYVTGDAPTVPGLVFNSQTSMGFQLVTPGNNTSKCDLNTAGSSNSDYSDSEEESESFNLDSTRTTSSTRDSVTSSLMQPGKLPSTGTQSKPLGGRGRTSKQNPVAEGMQNTATVENSTPLLNLYSKKKKKKRNLHEVAGGDEPVGKKMRLNEADSISLSISQSAVMATAAAGSTGTASAGRSGAVRDISGSLMASLKESTPSHGPSVAPVSPLSAASSDLMSLIVRIPLSVCKVQKPKAKVEPYNVVRPTPQRRSTSDGLGVDQEETRTGTSTRDMYGTGGRMRPDEYGGGVRDMHANRMRSHMSTRWERDDRRTYGLPSHGAGTREFSSGSREFGVARANVDYSTSARGGPVDYPRGGDYGGRGHIWERENAFRGNEEYWSDYEGSRMDTQRAGPASGMGSGRHGYSTNRMDPDSYMLEARKRKKEADKITVSC